MVMSLKHRQHAPACLQHLPDLSGVPDINAPLIRIQQLMGEDDHRQTGPGEILFQPRQLFLRHIGLGPVEIAGIVIRPVLAEIGVQRHRMEPFTVE